MEQILAQVAMLGFVVGFILGLGLAFAILAPLAAGWEKVAKRLMKMRGM